MGNISKSNFIPFMVIQNGGPPLLGRHFVRNFGIRICDLNYSRTRQRVESIPIVQQFGRLFDDGLGCFKLGKGVFKVKENAIPKFFRPRPLLLAIKSKVEEALDKLVSMGVLRPVNYSEKRW